jgi:hypothetical protein
MVMAFPPLWMLGLYRPGSVARASFALPRGHHGEVRLTVGEIKFSLDPLIQNNNLVISKYNNLTKSESKSQQPWD